MYDLFCPWNLFCFCQLISTKLDYHSFRWQHYPPPTVSPPHSYITSRSRNVTLICTTWLWEVSARCLVLGHSVEPWHMLHSSTVPEHVQCWNTSEENKFFVVVLQRDVKFELKCFCLYFPAVYCANTMNTRFYSVLGEKPSKQNFASKETSAEKLSVGPAELSLSLSLSISPSLSPPLVRPAVS